MATDETRKEYLFTTEEAALHVKRAPSNTKFYLHVRIDMPIYTDRGKQFTDGFSTSLPLSRKDALHLFSSSLSHRVLEERGGRIPVCDIHYTRNEWDRKLNQFILKHSIRMWIG